MMENDKVYTLGSDHKDFLKSSIETEPANSQETQRESESTFTILSSNVNVDINLGSLGDVPDNMEVTVDTPNMEQQIKVDNNLSTTQTALLPENLVLVETSKGLILSVADERFNFTNGLPAVSEDQGRTIITSSLPANIFTQIQPIGVCEEHSGTVYDTVGDGSHVVTTATILQPQPQFIMTSQEVTHQEEPKVKKKNGGGWPKGKKRKPDVQAPRKPMTGYVIFAVKRRQEIKETNPELRFAEVTKLLGQEWSSLPSDDKQTYMQLAEDDKTRYINEMQEFEKSDLFQTYVKNKKQNVNNNRKGLADDGNPLIDLEENAGMNELFCKVCNQYFISIHNKKEHMFGRQHLQNITDQIKKDIQEQADMQRQQMLMATSTLSPSNYEADGSEQNGLHTNMAHAGEIPHTSSSLDINDFLQEFMSKNFDRESEIQLLRKCKRNYEEENLAITKQFKELEEYESKLDQDLSSLKAYGASLSAQIDALKMVPTLFGVINF